MRQYSGGTAVKTRTEKAQRRERRVEMRNYGRVIAMHWGTVISVALAGLVFALIITTQTTPRYDSTTTLYVSVRAGNTGATGDLLQGSSFAQAAMTSYADIVTTALVLDQVVDELDLNIRSHELDSLLSVTSPAESVLLKITASHTDPETAARIANTTGNVFMHVLENDIESGSDGQNSPVQARIVDSALVPELRSGSFYIRNGILGVFIGALIGIGTAVLRHFFDTRIHSVQDLETFTGLPVLGRIPNEEHISRRPLIVHDDTHSQRAEAFRILRTNLQFLSTGESSDTFMVSSAMPGEGKTHTVANLAIVLAESGARVTLIDADLRNPRLAHVMGIEGAAGLSDVLIDRVELNDVLQPWGLRNLTVLPAGQIPPNPSELLGSKVMRDVIHELQSTSDYVLIDTPPVLPVTDAAVVSTLTSGTLLVMTIDQTKWREVEQALDAFDSVNSRLLGIIANREQFNAVPASGRRGTTYGSAQRRDRSRAVRLQT